MDGITDTLNLCASLPDSNGHLVHKGVGEGNDVWWPGDENRLDGDQ